MPQDFFCIHSIEGAHVLELALPEMLDSFEFDSLSEKLLGHIKSNGASRWIIDLSSVSYMGSAMLGLMVNLRQQIRSGGGQLVLCSMPATLLQIFHTCCMERLFVIAKNRADALKK